MSLSLSKLERARQSGGKIIARCPACAETGGDTSGEHLFLNNDGAFGCILYQSEDGADHRKRIFQLAGESQQAPAKEAKSTWNTLSSAPANAPFPSLNHSELGAPCGHWVYRTAEGRIAGIVARYIAARGKETRPMSWCRDQHGNTRWQWKAMAEPRPLYGLPFTQDHYVIAEGEKCADAITAAGLNGSTWAGGCGAVGKSDWQSLAGKSVTVWPDMTRPA